MLATAIEHARRHRRIVASAVYAGISTAALSLAYLARFEFDSRAVLNWDFGQALVLLVVIRLGINYDPGELGDGVDRSRPDREELTIGVARG
jgi:hypothetical protein